MKFWVTPELLVIPPPPMVRLNPGLAVIVKLLAPALNAIVLTWVLAEMEIPVVVETANVALLWALLGTTGGIQFGAVFQSPLTAFALQVALPPWRVWMLRIKMKARANGLRAFFIGTTLNNLSTSKNVELFLRELNDPGPVLDVSISFQGGQLS
jgi:hypothetical protein